VLVGFAALAELAGLGDLHAAQIVGNGPLAGSPPLFHAAASAVTANVGLAAWTVAALARSRADVPRAAAVGWPM
jgi:hypothetical protein